MNFITVILVALGIFYHQYSLKMLFESNPNVVFTTHGVNKWLLGLNDVVYWGLTFASAFILSILAASAGVVGLILAVIFAAGLVYDYKRIG